ncbi:MAG: PAS domain S-box protein [Thiobacillus sp.]|nr:PAS domain S-box protein [Thiobacillus sp.]
MLALVCIGMGIGIYQLQFMAATLDRVVRDDEIARGAVNTMMGVTRQRALVMTEALGTQDPFDRDEKLLAFDRLVPIFSAAFRRQINLSQSSAEKQVVAQQKQLIVPMIEHFEEVSNLARQGDLTAAARVFHGEVIPAQSRVLDRLMRWTELHYERHSRMVKTTQAQQQHVINTMFGMAAISVVVGILVAWVVYRWNRRLIAGFVNNETRLRNALAQSAFRQRALDEHSIVSVTDVRGSIIHANNKFCEVSGYSRAELIGENHRILKCGFHPPEFYQTIWATISQGNTWTGEIRNRAKNGREYWGQSTIVPMLDDAGVPLRYIAVCTEITQLKDMETSIREANLILQSNVLERSRELEEAKRRLEAELADRVTTQEALQKSYDELKSLHRQLQEAQQYLMQSEKMAAVGQLAAGMAHEINNPIGFIASNLATLGRYLETLGALIGRYIHHEAALDEHTRDAMIAFRQESDVDFVLTDARDLVKESRSGVERVRNIIKDLRDFARVDSDEQKQLVDVNQCMETTLQLLGERFIDGITIERAYGTVPLVECHVGDLNQVIVNLLNNAQQALQGKPGLIRLRSGVDGVFGWIEIEDTGEGIPEAILPLIFDPFFTTRPVGQGAGLGLSTAYGMVQQNGGTITVASQPGRGSTFRITLPLGAAPTAGDPYGFQPAAQVAADPGKPLAGLQPI